MAKTGIPAPFGLPARGGLLMPGLDARGNDSFNEWLDGGLPKLA